MKRQMKAVAFLEEYGLLVTARIAVEADARMRRRGGRSRVAALLTAAIKLDARHRAASLSEIPRDSKCPYSKEPATVGKVQLVRELMPA